MSPLSQPLERVFDLTPSQKANLKRLGLSTVRDLLFYFPTRYEDFSSPISISTVEIGTTATIQGTVTKIGTKKMFGKGPIPMVEAEIKDLSGTMRAIWFNQPSMARAFKVGQLATFSGKVHANKKGSRYFVNPAFTAKNTNEQERIIDVDGMVRPMPVYTESRGLASHWFQASIETILPLAQNEPEILPPEILKKYHLPDFRRAIKAIHKPEERAWAEGARKRFAFEEIFLIQLSRMRDKKLREAEPAYTIPPAHDRLHELAGRLPFALTGAQQKSVRQILEDFSRPHPMARLLEGDVGSGKTLVAVLASLAVHSAGYQVAYMAPTEILARQHFEEFCKHLQYFRATMGLLTSSECRKFPSKVDPSGSTHIAKSQLLSWVKDGTIDILVGTHAIIQKSVAFKNLSLVIVDEQHRFGVGQRSKLAQKGKTPHFLSMTATPIPRTLALTLYGDLALSLLDEMPPGRTRPITKIVPPTKRAATYETIRAVIASGGQMFVICPKIETKEDDSARSAEIKAVKDEYQRLTTEIFPEFRLAMLHGKMKPKEKEEIVQAFRKKEIDILVSTSVIEVGIDIPNASVIVIEGADRFGLASLHQFRGRVGRAGQESYCFLFTDSKNQKTLERLQALEKARNGFELAEYDLMLRGAGELSGSSQWGISDIGMEALKNIKMVEAAREEARNLVEEDIELKKYPSLAERIRQVEQQELHFE
jgi:ATP-dependent DNA helicase RecG